MDIYISQHRSSSGYDDVVIGFELLLPVVVRFKRSFKAASHMYITSLAKTEDSHLGLLQSSPTSSYIIVRVPFLPPLLLLSVRKTIRARKSPEHVTGS